MSIYTDNTANPSTKYLHYDSLNSVDTITNNLGVVESRIAYKPFGEKLNLDKEGKTTQTPPKTNRGYTGHEHIEDTKYINMNARLYDPTIGRFLSADTVIDGMYTTQGFNRYSYVKNNPLKYTDPSGHWGWSSFKRAFKKVVHAVKKNIKTIVTVAVAVVVTIAVTAATGGGATPLLSPMWAAIAGGAAGGFAGGAVGTQLNGGTLNETLYYPRKIKQHFLNHYSKRAKITIENERVIA